MAGLQPTLAPGEDKKTTISQKVELLGPIDQQNGSGRNRGPKVAREATLLAIEKNPKDLLALPTESLLPSL